ncbi:hypothetical protein ACGFNU_41815 [Spirillospora sp. NPDC048911]|uniref:hypothetical protein n=1 Tax=Spirillospora sp. NPDC048911 TaxID=3364527 RepID=UPI003720FD56
MEIQSNLFEVAVPAVEVMLAALSESEANYARREFINILVVMAAGDSHRSETERGRPNLGGECRARILEGINVILHEGMYGDGEAALDIFDVVERDEERFEYYESILA